MITGKISGFVEDKIGTPVSLQGIGIDWLDAIELTGLYLEDQQQDTLLYLGRLRVEIEPWALLNKRLMVELVDISNLYANVYKVPETDSLNFAYIPEAFAASDTTQTQDTTSSSFTIEARQLELQDIRFDFIADSTQAQVALGELSLLLETLGLEEEHIQAEELAINGLNVLLRLSQSSPPDTTQDSAPTPDSLKNVINPSAYQFSLADFSIDNSKIDYQVGASQPETDGKLNFEDLLISDLGIQINDIEVGRTNASLDLENFTFSEQRSGFALQQLALNAAVDMPRVEATLQQLRTGHSKLNGTLAIGLSMKEKMADLINSLSVQSELNRAELSLTDVTYFTNALDSLPALKNSEINLWWNIDLADGNGKIQDLELRIDDRLSLAANAEFSELGKLDSEVAGSPYFDFSAEPLSSNLAFVRQIAGENAGLPRLANDTLVLKASAQGRLEDIRGDLSLRTSVGRLLAEGQYQQTSTGGMNVNASLTGQQFALQRLLKALGQDTLAQDFGNLTFQARVEAQQTVTPTDTAFSQAKWDLEVDHIDYKDYRYEELHLEGDLANEKLNSQINYEDSLLALNVDAALDMSQPELAYRLDLKMDEANLFRLNLSNDSIILQDVQLLIDLQGTNPDSVLGTVRMPSANVIKGEDKYKLDTLLFKADRVGDTRKISLYSNYIDALVEGQFSVAQMPQTFEDFEQYYFTGYQAPYINQDTVNTFKSDGQKLQLELHIRETPLLVRAFVPALKIPDTLSLEAAFDSQEKSMRLDLKAPHVEYGSNVVDSLYIYTITTERQIGIDLLTNFVQVGGLNIPKFLIAGKLSGVPNEDQRLGRQRLTTTELDLNMKVGENDAPYRLDLNTLVKTQQDTVTIAIDDSEVVLDNRAWTFSNRGRIQYAQNFLDIDQLFLQQGDQELYISTENQDDRSDLQLAIHQFEVQPFLNSIDLDGYEIAGVLHGEAALNDLFQSGAITADLNIDHLTVKDTVLGDFELQATKSADIDGGVDLLELLAELEGPNGDLRVDGTYDLADSISKPINLELKLTDFLLDPWKVFLEGQMNELSGELFADLNITGSPTKPDIEGIIRFGDYVVIESTASSARYHIENQEMRFSGEELLLSDFTILDSAGTPAVLDGTIFFGDLLNPAFDLTFETQKFRFVNSQSYENEAFYGLAIASADASVKGPVSDLIIEGKVEVNEGTNMTISLVSDPAEIEQAGFVEFVDVNAFIKADSVIQDSLIVMGNSKAQSDSVTISGFTLDANIHLNPEAVFTIIVDPIRGDKITAAGEAELQVNMNPSGDLNLQGTYILNRGQYVLNFAEVVKKEFSIREGSSIAWSGDPVNARMDLTAAYEVETDLRELFQDVLSGGSAGDLRRLVTVERPVFVELLINGTLDDPQLVFDLGLPEITAGGIYSDLVTERFNQVEQNETELYKQVFGLIVLGRFIPISGGFGSSGGGSYAAVNDQINSSVSQVLTQQLNSLTEEYLGGVQFNLDLESSDDSQAQNSLLTDRDVSVGFSKELFNDRLTVEVGGMATTGETSQSSQAIYGEFTVLYELTEGGNLMVKVFQTSDRDQVLSQIQQRQGASILYERSFNRLLKDGFFQDRPVPIEDDEQPEPGEVNTNTIIQNEPRPRKPKGQD
ncbi:MAG: translocation/assembly module TamB domain-containing protein [Bacteroidota bacterium]